MLLCALHMSNAIVCSIGLFVVRFGSIVLVEWFAFEAMLCGDLSNIV